MSFNILIDGRPAQHRPRGMGVYVTRLVRALVDCGSDYTFTVALDRKAGEDPWKDSAVLQRVWGEAGSINKWEQSELPKLAAKTKVDLLHCTANTAPKKCPVPYVVTIHDAIFMRPFSHVAETFRLRTFLGHMYYRLTVSKTARKARQIITVSQASYADLVSKVGVDKNKINVILNASPYKNNPLPEEHLKEVLSELGLERPYIIAFGAVDLRKNTANLIRAFARLPRAAANTLVLLGFEKADQTTIPHLIIHQGLKDRVRIMDYLSEEKLTAVFQAAAAFAYPSKAEGFGLPILQAFNLGVPVVTSQIDSIPEVAGEAVRYADPNDPQSITHELLSILIDSNEAHRLAISGYMQAKKFSWEKAAEQTLAVYGKCLAE